MDTARPGETNHHDTELTLDQLERNFRDARAVLTGYQAGLTALIESFTTGLDQLTELREQLYQVAS